MQDPGDHVTEQSMSQYDESERGTVEPKTARDTVSHSKRKGESLVPDLKSALKVSYSSNTPAFYQIGSYLLRAGFKRVLPQLCVILGQCKCKTDSEAALNASFE